MYELMTANITVTRYACAQWLLENGNPGGNSNNDCYSNKSNDKFVL